MKTYLIVACFASLASMPLFAQQMLILKPHQPAGPGLDLKQLTGTTEQARATDLSTENLGLRGAAQLESKSKSAEPLLRKARGGADPGGGYEFEDTSYRHIKIAQKDLVQSIQALNQNDLDRYAELFEVKPFKKNKLISIIENIEFAETDPGIRYDEKGQLRPILDMDYTLENGGKIAALRPFFQFFHKFELIEAEKYSLRRKIIHEASHLLGIGITDNQASVNFSKSLLYELRRMYVNCGGAGSIESRKESCNRNGLYGPTVMEYRNLGLNGQYNYDSSTPLNAIYDRRSDLGFLVASLFPVNFRDGTSLKNAETICSSVNNLDGQILWRPVSAQELDKILENRQRKDDLSKVALANGQVSYAKRNSFSSDEIRITEMTNSKDIPFPVFISVFCVGTVN